MELRELRYFAAVYEERSVTAAARRCYISQPSVSAAVAQLEQELEAPLFLRHRKGVAPTAAADQLYPVARRLLDQAQALRGLFRQAPPRRSLSLGLMSSLDIERTLALLQPLTGAADLDLRLVGADDPCDARIVSRGLLTRGEAFLPLWKERYILALPPGHPLTLKPRLRAADLPGLRLVDRCHCENAKAFDRARGLLQTVAVAQSEEWAVALVAAGVGAAILPEGVVRDPRVAVREIADVRAVREVGLAYGRAGAAPALQSLLALIKTGLKTGTAAGRRKK
jgi:DNA-binding transcriptional LysR family regulator